jgi:AraC-like DNA-binding protein
MNNSTIYIVASALIIYYAYRSNQLIGKAKSEFDLGGEQLLWIKRIIQSYRVYFSLVLSVLLVDLVLYNVINDTSYFYFERFYYYPFFIGLAVLTYWIGLEGFSRRKNPGIVFKNVLGTEQRDRLAEIAVLIEAAMRSDKLYKDPQLSLNLLAEHIQTKSYLVSLCFSEVIKKRFNDYINEFRVEEVQALLKNPDSSKYTLLSLALEAGFNSKSSFNRAIGKHLGISPKQLKLNNPTENG